jgi:beta-lactamase class A
MKSAYKFTFILLAILLLASTAWSECKPVFRLLSPPIAWMNTEKYLKLKQNYSENYCELKQRIFHVLKNSPDKGHYGVYFEDLNTGSWIGINEKDEFPPASLMKLPIMVAIAKKIEDGELTLEKKVTIEKEDIDLRWGTLGLKGAGYQTTIKELLTCLIQESDNTAEKIFYRRFMTREEFFHALMATGIPPRIHQDKHVTLTPKQYSNILRSLYYSTYLRRIFSELCLSIMTQTDYNKLLPAGIPSGINISHKYGLYSLSGKGGHNEGYNDCGIVHYPDKPYILCVMGIHTTKK